MDLSAFYFDVLKDRLYTFAPRSAGRRSAQTAIYRIANALVTLIAPTLVFTSEEVWKYLPRAASDPESVHMALFPDPEPLVDAFDDARSENWERLLAVREEVLKALEQSRASKQIAAPLEARVALEAAGELGALLRKYNAVLPSLFIVSQVEVVPRLDAGSATPGIAGLQIRVQKAAGQKCPRCWNYSTHVGESTLYPTVCERCAAALSEIDRDSPPEALAS